MLRSEFVKVLRFYFFFFLRSLWLDFFLFWQRISFFVLFFHLKYQVLFLNIFPLLHLFENFTIHFHPSLLYITSFTTVTITFFSHQNISITPVIFLTLLIFFIPTPSNIIIHTIPLLSLLHLGHYHHYITTVIIPISSSSCLLKPSASQGGSRHQYRARWERPGYLSCYVSSVCLPPHLFTLFLVVLVPYIQMYVSLSRMHVQLVLFQHLHHYHTYIKTIITPTSLPLSFLHHNWYHSNISTFIILTS